MTTSLASTSPSVAAAQPAEEATLAQKIEAWNIARASDDQLTFHGSEERNAYFAAYPYQPGEKNLLCVIVHPVATAEQISAVNAKKAAAAKAKADRAEEAAAKREERAAIAAKRERIAAIAAKRAATKGFDAREAALAATAQSLPETAPISAPISGSAVFDVPAFDFGATSAPFGRGVKVGNRGRVRTWPRDPAAISEDLKDPTLAIGLTWSDPDLKASMMSSEDEFLHRYVAYHLREMAKKEGGPALPLTEIGNTQRFLACFPDVVVVPAWKHGQNDLGIAHFEDGVWKRDLSGWALKRAAVIADSILIEQKGVPDVPSTITDEDEKAVAEKEHKDEQSMILSHAAKSQTVAKQKSMVEGLTAYVGRSERVFDGPSTDRGINTASGFFDYGIPVRGRDGSAPRPAPSFIPGGDPDLMTMRQTPVAFENIEDEPVEYKRVILEIANGRQDLADFIDDCFAVSITPAVSGRLFIMLWGPRAGNGKTTICEIGGGVLGGLEEAGDILGYAASFDPEAIMADRSKSGHNEALSPFCGNRFVYAEEVEEGRPLDGALVRRLTSGGTIPLRRIFGRQGNYRATATPWLGVNTPPDIKNFDTAMKDRIVVIPCDHRFVRTAAEITGDDADATLGEKGLAARVVEAEGPKILAHWLRRGQEIIARGGIGEFPQCVKEATAVYHDGEDQLGRYFREKVVFAKTKTDAATWETQFAQIYAPYQVWCELEGETPRSKKFVVQTLTKLKNCKPFVDGHGYKHYRGVLTREEAIRRGEIPDPAYEATNSEPETVESSIDQSESADDDYELDSAA